MKSEQKSEKAESAPGTMELGSVTGGTAGSGANSEVRICKMMYVQGAAVVSVQSKVRPIFVLSFVNYQAFTYEITLHRSYLH